MRLLFMHAIPLRPDDLAHPNGEGISPHRDLGRARVKKWWYHPGCSGQPGFDAVQGSVSDTWRPTLGVGKGEPADCRYSSAGHKITVAKTAKWVVRIEMGVTPPATNW